MFNKEEDYVPEDPADKLYNEGLFLLNNKQDYEAAAKKFDEVDRQNPYSDWARKALLMSAFSYYQAREVRRLHQRRQALRDAASGQPGRRLRAISDRHVLLRSDSRRHPRPGARRQGGRRARRGGAQISEYRIRAQRQEKDRHGARPARRQGNGDRPLLHEKARLHRRHQPFQGGGDALPDHARGRRSAGAADRSLCFARHFGRGADRGRRARPQFPG